MSKKHKHLSFDDRLEIEYGLKNDYSFKHIAKIVEKDCTTISKEIRNHFKIVNSGAVGRSFFDCVHGKECKRNIFQLFQWTIIGSGEADRPKKNNNDDEVLWRYVRGYWKILRMAQEKWKSCVHHREQEDRRFNNPHW